LAEFIASFVNANQTNPHFMHVPTSMKTDTLSIAIYEKAIQNHINTATTPPHENLTGYAIFNNIHASAATTRFYPTTDHPLKNHQLLLTQYVVMTEGMSGLEPLEAPLHETIIYVLEITSPDKMHTHTFISAELKIPKCFDDFTVEIIVSTRTKESNHEKIPIFAWTTGNYEIEPEILDHYRIKDQRMLRGITDILEKLDPEKMSKVFIIDHGCGNGRLLNTLSTALGETFPQFDILFIGYDPNQNALQNAQETNSFSLFYIHADTQEFIKTLDYQNQFGNPQEVSTLIHLDSGGPFHLQVVTWAEAQENMQAVIHINTQFPKAIPHFLSTGQSPSFYDHEQMEGLGWTTQTFGQRFSADAKNIPMYHGIFQNSL